MQEPCQSLLSASSANSQCAPVGNCTGLSCEQRNNALNGSSVWFTVQKCEDPVIVDLMIQSGTLNTQWSFTQNDTVFLGSNSLSVAMQRNASYLQFQVIKNIIIRRGKLNSQFTVTDFLILHAGGRLVKECKKS